MNWGLLEGFAQWGLLLITGQFKVIKVNCLIQLYLLIFYLFFMDFYFYGTLILIFLFYECNLGFKFLTFDFTKVMCTFFINSK